MFSKFADKLNIWGRGAAPHDPYGYATAIQSLSESLSQWAVRPDSCIVTANYLTGGKASTP